MAESVPLSTDVELRLFCTSLYPRLLGALSLYCADEDLAEDLTQDALVRVCTHWKTVRGADNPQGWAYRVAINLAKSHFRREAIWRRVLPRAAPARGQVSTDGYTPVDVREAVFTLPPRERVVVILRFYVDLTVNEVAALTGFPEGSVKTLTRRAVQLLRRDFQTDEDDD
jgi:RNA polymerase sigma factor (sigma-70 family)